MDEPILAALIFTYNHKPYIAKCIESLVNQKTTYRYQVRIYDDCSTDGTTEICREYADKYPDKIRLTVQPENTYLKPYSEMQHFKAAQEIDTKYFCIIDGDDCWCDNGKLQLALDCLENNPEYAGFAHDTRIVNDFYGTEESYIHKRWVNFENPVMKKATPYFLTSSRIFRNYGFRKENLGPADYLIYFYHAVRGPIFYCDRIMAENHIGAQNCFGNADRDEERLLNTTFGYKIAKFFDFKEDELAMSVQEYYNSKSVRTILRYKRFFGNKWGWILWYCITFIPVYGFECLNLNWCGSRFLIKQNADNRIKVETKRLQKVRKNLSRKIFEYKLLCQILDYGFVCGRIRYVLHGANKKRKMKIQMLKRKYRRIKHMLNELKQSDNII